jgi:hypothetical protein
VEIMKKALMLFLLCWIISLSCILGLVSCGLWQGDVVLVENYASVDDLIKDSPTIVIGVVDDKSEEIKYGEVTFRLTQFKVDTTVRGTTPDTINILQTKISQDPALQSGKKMILFLGKYIGPVTEDAYRIRGLYQGQYEIEGTRVVKNKNNKLAGNEVLESLDALISRINAIDYVP